MSLPLSTLVASNPAGAGGFIPITDAYTTSSGTRLVPSGAIALTVEIYGKGGDGGLKTAGIGGGGGGGAYSSKSFTVVAGDYGKTITWNTANGSNATVVGDAAATNLTAAALNMAAGKGSNGTNTTGGTGGTASGGTTNSTGTAGQNSPTGTGGRAAGPSGGAGGAAQADGVAPGGGGGGGDVDFGGGLGATPKIILSWT